MERTDAVGGAGSRRPPELTVDAAETQLVALQETAERTCGARASTRGLERNLPPIANCGRSAGHQGIHRDANDPHALIEWIDNEHGGVDWVTAEEK